MYWPGVRPTRQETKDRSRSICDNEKNEKHEKDKDPVVLVDSSLVLLSLELSNQAGQGLNAETLDDTHTHTHTLLSGSLPLCALW